MKIVRTPALISAGVLLVSTVVLPAANITWTNTSGGSWSAAVNWNPNQVPTNTDTVRITTPGTYTVNFDFSANSLFFNPSVTIGAGANAGVQTLAITNFFTTFTNLMVTNGGAVINVGGGIGQSGQTMTVDRGHLTSINSSFGNNLIVTNGGTVTSTNTIFTTLTIQNATVTGTWDTVNLLAVGAAGVFNEFKFLGLGGAVQTGGTLNILDGTAAVGLPYSILNMPFTNFGTINITNTGFLIGYGTGEGGIQNQPGGVINLWGAASITGVGYIDGDFTFFTNKGQLNELAGAGSTIDTSKFDSTSGTVSNLSGTLLLQTLNTLAGTYSAGAGATIQLAGGTNNLVVGAPFALAGAGQFQLVSGNLTLPTTWNTNLALQGSTLTLGPGFQGGAITNLALDGITLSNTLPVTGFFGITNSSVSGNFTVANHGTLATSNVFLGNTVSVADGGFFSVNGGYTGPIIVSAGGQFVAVGTNTSFLGHATYVGPLTNSGTAAFSNCVVMTQGIANQPGAVLNLGENCTIESAGAFVINKGNIVQEADSTTNSIAVATCDNTGGTIANFSGVLAIGSFPNTLAGKFSTASGATDLLSGGTAANPAVPGASVLVTGAGLTEFVSGYLFFPTDTVRGLTLLGGTLVLGPGFQGGAITNLTLSGITLTNTLPVTGTFTDTNGAGQFSGSPLYGNFTVASGGLFNNGADVYGNLTVAKGGSVVYAGPSIVEPAGSMLVATGATVNLSGGGPSFYGPLTNAGTINISNPPAGFLSGLYFLNDGVTYHGGMVNAASGVLNFGSDRTAIFSGQGGFEYLINNGTIVKTATGPAASSPFPPLSSCGLAIETNNGTITAQTGSLVLGFMVLAPSGNLNVGINNQTNYGIITLATTNAVLAGAFNATLNNGFVPTNGSVFTVVAYPSATGTFSSLGLPPTVTWQHTYGSTNFTLTVAGVNAILQFAHPGLSGTNLVVSGSGGTAGGKYVILASTNAAVSVTNWTALVTNSFDGSGNFSFTNPVSPAKPHQFFIIRSP